MCARVFAVFAALIATTTILEAATISKKKIDAWTVTAHTNDSTGAFSHCTAFASYKSGNHLFFSISRSLNWYMRVVNLNWKRTHLVGAQV